MPDLFAFLTKCYQKTYSKPSQKSMMKFFCENSYSSCYFCKNNSILDIWLASEFTSDYLFKGKLSSKVSWSFFSCSKRHYLFWLLSHTNNVIKNAALLLVLQNSCSLLIILNDGVCFHLKHYWFPTFYFIFEEPATLGCLF